MNVTTLVQTLLSCYTLFPDGSHPSSVQMTSFQLSPTDGITVHTWTNDTEKEVQKIKFDETGFDRIRIQMMEKDGKVVLGGQVGKKQGEIWTNCPVAGDMEQLSLVFPKKDCIKTDCFYRMKDMIYMINVKAGDSCAVYNLTGTEMWKEAKLRQDNLACSSPLGLNSEENFFVFKKDGECKEIDYSVLNTTWTPTPCAEHKIELEPNVYSKLYHLRYLMAISGCGQNMTDTNVIDNTYVKFLYKPTEPPSPAKLEEDNNWIKIVGFGVLGLLVLIALIVVVIVFRMKLMGCVGKRHEKAKNGDKEDSKMPEKVGEKDVPVKDLAVKKTEEVKPKEEPAKQEKASVVEPISVSKDEFGKGMKVLKEKSERAKKAEEMKKKEKEIEAEKKREQKKDEERKEQEKEEGKEQEKEMKKKKEEEEKEKEKEEEKEDTKEEIKKKEKIENLLKAAEKYGFFTLPNHKLVPTEMVVDEKTKEELPKILHCSQTYTYVGHVADGKIGKVFKYKDVSKPDVEVAVKFVNKSLMEEALKEITAIRAVQKLYGQVEELYLHKVLENGQFPKSIFTITPLYYGRMTYFVPGFNAFRDSTEQARMAVAWAYLKCIRQLHSLGYGHNDIRPYNFMRKTKKSTTLVLCNFDKVLPFGTKREKRDEGEEVYQYYPCTAYDLKKTSNVDDYQSWLFMLTTLLEETNRWMVDTGTHEQKMEAQYNLKKKFFAKLIYVRETSADKQLLYDLKMEIMGTHGPERLVDEKKVVRLMEEYAKKEGFTYESVDWTVKFKDPM